MSEGINPFEIEIGGYNKSTLNFIKKKNIKVYAELGCNHGNTAYKVAEVLPEGSEIYLFDFETNIEIVIEKLKIFEGKLKIFYFPNSFKERDSYCWSLIELIKKDSVTFDYVYIDGAHDLVIDGFAFFLCDRLLKDGGYIDFDDYSWTFSTSPTANPGNFPKVNEWYTQYQLDTAQIKMFVDSVVKSHPKYEEIIKNKIFRKRYSNNQDINLSSISTKGLLKILLNRFKRQIIR